MTRVPLFKFLLLLFSLSLTTCTSPKKLDVPPKKFDISKAERTCLKEFFQDLLFDHAGTYTLFGSKPVTLSFIEEPRTRIVLNDVRNIIPISSVLF